MTITTDKIHPSGGEHSGMYDPKAARKPSNTLKPEDFIRLLTEQLKHQDPTKPMDSAAMLGQMSQLSTLQSNTQLQETMKSVEAHVNDALANTQFVQAAQLVDKNVEVLSNVTPLTDKGLMGSVSVPEGSTNVVVTIKDPSGLNVVKTVNLGNPKTSKGGLMDFAWDGKEIQADGTIKTYDPGLYKISATAEVGGKQAQLNYTMGTFKVNSAALGSEGVVLNLQDKGGVPIQDIIKIL